ncbi:uncharacterized protein BXZ73DRAFT_103531 [Epithele typhae]|uniref:uncharacterized protein n=1 Tax=Epithele typhae TaxID=378194 RepID=UPI0020079C1F|nr:uncharacterized protein BXZ73DRAFT_103531 [Epithele typhae]KAH9924692.1 hypothetical protein BXZ73DRAFT_103531 [Epithele typhae]
MDTVDIPFDSIWCLVCSRQIVPKRLRVPVDPQPTPAPPASPTALASNAAQLHDVPARLARGKTGTIRPRAQGLVHGTGRVKPNGTIKRSPTKDTHDSKPPPPAPKSNTPIRHRTVIDQTPAPLYCSDECRLADLQSIHGAIDIKYNPERCASPRLPPVPPNSYIDGPSSLADSDSSSGASLESRSSIASPTTTTTPAVARAASHTGDLHQDVYARMSAIYGFAPLPPPPPFSSRPKKAEPVVTPMEGGIMMAARRIQAALCPEKPPKRSSSWGIPVHHDPTQDNKPIPGWTDGSQAWRESVYGIPSQRATRASPEEAAIIAQGSYASPHRSSRGVVSTMGEGKPATEVRSSASTSALPSPALDRSTQELYRQYSASFMRRSESRNSVPRASTLSTSPTGSAREVSILKPGAEGLLLVPDVKMRRVNSGMSSTDGSSVASDASVDSVTTESDEDDLEAACSLPTSRPSNNRTWSYASEKYTYPIMRVAPKKVKRIERQVIDGVEQDVEVEILVEEPIKRLFLFGGARD